VILLDELKTYLGLADGEQDPLLEGMIERATALVGRELGGYWFGAPRGVMELYTGGRPIIWLNQLPTPGTEVAVFVRDAEAVGIWELVPPATYELANTRLYRPLPWPEGQGAVRVVCTVGWPAGQGPTDVQDVVWELVVARYRGKGREHVASESLVDYSYSRRDLDETAGWRGVLRRWRRRRL
jgi:hypothetical protein